MVNGQRATYEQQKLGPSTYYDRLWVHPNGIHTEPLEFHMTRAGGSCMFLGTTNSSLGVMV